MISSQAESQHSPCALARKGERRKPKLLEEALEAHRFAFQGLFFFLYEKTLSTSCTGSIWEVNYIIEMLSPGNRNNRHRNVRAASSGALKMLTVERDGEFQ